jgi:acyl carrier protein
MKRDEILGHVKRIAGEQGYLEENVTLNASLRDDLGMDSLDIVEFTMGIEEHFRFNSVIPEGVADEWKSIADIVVYLETQPQLKLAHALERATARERHT